jgi:YqaJ-like viral recombinase domain
MICQFQFRHSTPVQPISSSTAACGSTSFPHSVTAVSLPANYQPCNEQRTISLAEAVLLEQRTIKQNSCAEWHEERKFRITASVFCKIMKRKMPVTPHFLKNLFNTSSFVSAPTEYGKSNENSAKDQYIRAKPGVHVHDCGLVVNPSFNFLGASPDGKVCDNGVTGILEIKCPYNARNMTITDAVTTAAQDRKFNFCLSMRDEHLSLTPSHDYYYQVQGQLLVTGATFCDFVVYTKRDLHIERIIPDFAFQQTMLIKLANFYLNHAMPYFLQLQSTAQPYKENNSEAMLQNEIIDAADRDALALQDYAMEESFE